MKRTLALVFAVVALVGSTLAYAETFTHDKSGLKFELPKGWHTEGEGDSMIAMSDKPEVIMWFDVIKPSELEAYIKDADKQIAKHLKNVKVTSEAKTEKINGLEHHFMEGTGTWEGEKVDWDFTIVTGGKLPLGIIAAGEQLDGKVIQGIYSSIKK